MSTDTIILTRSQVASLLHQEECIAAVEEMFRLHGEGKTQEPSILGVHAVTGGFHIKAGVMDLSKSYFVAKMNANFPGNPKQFSLPTIQGVVIVCDAANGRLLALTDSIEITIQRTGAATAVAAKYLAKKSSEKLAVIGCGNQGRVSMEMLSSIFSFKEIRLFDTEPINAQKLQTEASLVLKNVGVCATVQEAVKEADIIITCTPSRKPFLTRDMVSPGAFIAAVGADNEEKQELDEALVFESKLVADITAQCATIGELHHALERGLVTREHVYAQLGEVVSGRKEGRTSEEEIIIFDSTGMALQDVASAVIVYEKAITRNNSLSLDFMA